jgi:hypothetical protein
MGHPPQLFPKAVKAEALTESDHRHVADVITGQLKGGFAPNSWLGIVGERGEAVKAARILMVLV